MAKTFEERRPTPVTVIGWAWIILGLFMLLSGSFGLILQATTPQPDTTALDSDVPFAAVWNYIWLFASVQIVFAATGVFAGVRFLALQAWARTALELLSWLLLLALVGYAVVWVSNFSGIAGGGDGSSFGLVFAAAGVLVTLMYGAPVTVMIYHLRTAKVRDAVE